VEWHTLCSRRIHAFEEEEVSSECCVDQWVNFHAKGLLPAIISRVLERSQSATVSVNTRSYRGIQSIATDYQSNSIFINLSLPIINLAFSFNFFLIHFAVSSLTVLAFPQDSMSFIVHCQLVVHHCRSAYRRHGVWVKVVRFVPY
jgi:hypothetical protein